MLPVMNIQVCQITICPRSYAKCGEDSKKQHSSSLSEKDIWSFDGLLALIGLEHKDTHEAPRQCCMQRTKNRTSSIWFVLIRLGCQSSEHLPNCSYTHKLVRNRAQNCVYPQKIPFWYDMCRRGVRVSRNVVVRVPQSFRIKANQKTSKHSQCQGCSLIFGIKIRIEIDQIGLSLNTQWICRTILVQSCQVNQTLCCLQKRKLVVKAVKAVLCGVIHAKAAPEPRHDTGSNHRKSACLTSNYCSSPKRHLHIFNFVVFCFLLIKAICLVIYLNSIICIPILEHNQKVK